MKFPSRESGSCHCTFDYTVVLGKQCHKICLISWVLPSKFIGTCDKKHLSYLPSAHVLPSFKLRLDQVGHLGRRESQMLFRDGWLQPDGSGGRGKLAQAKTAQGSYSTNVHGDGRRSFLECRSDQAQFSESRS